MVAVVKDRPKLKPLLGRLRDIRDRAESCARQLTGWTTSIEDSPVKGKRHLTGDVKQQRQAVQSYRQGRNDWLRSLKPAHPLHDSPEARAARGERVE